MDIDRLLGASVETCLGQEIGEVVGIEILGPRITIIIASDWDFSLGGPDDNGGLPVDKQDILTQVSEDGDNIVAFRQQRF